MNDWHDNPEWTRETEARARPADQVHPLYVIDALVRRGEGPEVQQALKEIAGRCAVLPVLDDRTEDEILGYGEDGLPS